ncbi:MAG: YHYH protein [Salinibacterium sp.]|nr:YHYH protein [Salinibacterium sp.]
MLAAGCTTQADTTDTPTTAPTATAAASGEFAASSGDCAAMAATFRSVVSANPGDEAPTLSADCSGETLVVASNSIPDYLYVATTPEVLRASEQTVSIAVNPVEAATPSAVPMLGTIAVAVDGVAIYGPTEATGGDVLSLVGALSECGSHSSPVQFHLHLFGWADGVDCLYSATEAESGKSIVVGWSPDGYPIMSGLVCADAACTSTTQLTSSWQLTDSSLFASDTWSAHSYVAGSGDLDQCNGRVDADGQYRYYTTTTFPYFLGCYHGVVADGAIVGSGAGGPPGRG